MKRQRIIMAGLLIVLAAFVAGSWAGLRQWWDSLTFRSQAIAVGLLFCVVSGVAGHLTGTNPLLILAGLIFLRIVAYGVQAFRAL